ncbi:MAG TPA: hypothetical protein DD473_09700 [Planctomycetaceae bacterium]|nr:hypothetical protein [Planctomycetaceae bacterium]
MTANDSAAPSGTTNVICDPENDSKKIVKWLGITSSLLEDIVTDHLKRAERIEAEQGSVYRNGKLTNRILNE